MAELSVMTPVAHLTEEFNTRHRPGRRGRDDLYYAELAQAYVSRLGSRTPVEDLAQELHLSGSQLRNLLYIARRRGLLSGAPDGKAGGQLTDKAKEILSGHHQAP